MILDSSSTSATLIAADSLFSVGSTPDTAVGQYQADGLGTSLGLVTFGDAASSPRINGNTARFFARPDGTNGCLRRFSKPLDT